MPEKVITEKVLCYVVRDGRLLVFRHADYSYERDCTVFGVTPDQGVTPDDDN